MVQLQCQWPCTSKYCSKHSLDLCLQINKWWPAEGCSLQLQPPWRLRRTSSYARVNFQNSCAYQVVNFLNFSTSSHSSWFFVLIVVYLDILPYTNPKPNHLVFYFVLNYKFALWMVSFSKDLDKFVSRPFATFQQTTFTRAQEDITGDSYQN